MQSCDAWPANCKIYHDTDHQPTHAQIQKKIYTCIVFTYINISSSFKYTSHTLNGTFIPTGKLGPLHQAQRGRQGNPLALTSGTGPPPGRGG